MSRANSSRQGFAFSERGDVALKGFEEPLRLFEVRWRD
jgi:class 3 adenylate cyclase